MRIYGASRTSSMAAESNVRKSYASTVAGGIVTSRLLGLVRESIALRFFGIGPHTDILQAAFRFPNILQNLLGEGTISAAFIPVYTRLLEEGRQKDAGRFAGCILGLLVVLVSAVVLVGIVFARPLVSLVLFGWTGDAALVAAGELSVDRLELTIQAVRLVFPMAGILVLSAWALGVLNSHRRFFLPYFAPVLWNIAIISGLFVGAYVLSDHSATAERSLESLDTILFTAFVGALVGGLLQLLVQLPLVFRVLRGFRVSISTRVEGVRTALRAFGPAVAGRGIAQLSGYMDLILASQLAVGAVAALRPALILYLLPTSLFGLSVAAAELPNLSRLGASGVQPFLQRLGGMIRQSMFLTIPTATGYIALGYVVVGGLFRSGQFDFADNVLVYTVLGAYSLGLVATTVSRLLQNAFWALGDTATPAKIAGLRVAVSVCVAVPLMLYLDRWSVAAVTGQPGPAEDALYFGAVGLALGASVAAWVEVALLQSKLRRRLTSLCLPWRRMVVMAGLAVASVVPALLLWLVLPPWPALVRAVLVVGVYAATYLSAARVMRFEEVESWVGRFMS